ncbi:MAG: hypothetical protein AAFY64_07685, partial [Pseudomonadota bacterium]
EIRFMLGTSGTVRGRDPGCEVPSVSMRGWRGAAQPRTLSTDGPEGSRPLEAYAALLRKDPALFRGAEAIWRTRPTGGECVLLTRFEVAPPRRRRETPIVEFADADLPSAMPPEENRSKTIDQ